MELKTALEYTQLSCLTMLSDGNAAVFRARCGDIDALVYNNRFFEVRFDGRPLIELKILEGASALCALNGEYPIAFVKGQDLYLGDPASARVRHIALLPAIPNRLSASADGRRVVFIAETPSEEDLWLRQQGIIIENREVPAQVFAVDLADGKIVALTSTPTVKKDADCSPDGTRIVYTELSREVYGQPYCAALKMVDLAGHGTTLLDGTVRCSSPRWSPDGKQIAFLVREPSVFRDDYLALISAAGGAVRNLSSMLDRRVKQHTWADNCEIRFLLIEGLFVNLWKADAVGGALTRLSSGATWIDFDMRPNNRRMIYTRQNFNEPTELFAADADTLDERRLTDFNAALRADCACRIEVIEWRNSLGMPIEGVWVRAPHAQGVLPPLIMENHGSTPGAYHASFAPMKRYMASLGASTLMLNYRGSSGYGRNFMEAVAGCWCSGPAEDCVLGVKKLIAAKAVDPARIGAAGASGGATMSSAAIGLYPDVFRAAVLNCGQYDFGAIYIGAAWKNTIDFLLGGAPWEVPEMYRKESSINYAGRVRIPVLMFCGEQDLFSISQSHIYYTALRGHTTAEFVHYTNEGHGLRQMNHILDCEQRAREWFRKYLEF